MIKRTISNILPAGTIRGQAARKLKHYIKHPIKRDTISYHKWISHVEPTTWSDIIAPSDKTPMFTIVVPVFNTPDHYIEPLLVSVINQTYPKWQLCLADASTDAARAKRIKELATQDDRITYVRLTKNHGIAGNTNEAIKHAAGDFIGFLDHDDILSPHALNEIAAALQKNPKTELFYSDEDKLTDSGRSRILPFFKPDWSPELFLSVNYLTHFVVIKKELLHKIKGLRTGFDGAQDYDFLLRATDATEHIHHIPKILYHWRMAKGSTARAIGEKSYADQAGRKALSEHLKRKSIRGRIEEVTERPTNYRIKYELTGNPLVSIIIPFKDKADLLEQCVESIINKTYYEHYEIILVSNNSTEPATEQYLESLKDEKNIKILTYDKPFNYSAVNNFGRKHARGEVLCFLNNDMEVLNGEWLEEIASVAIQPEIGVVGGWLFYPDKRIQHAGVVLGMGGMAGHVFRLLKPGVSTPFGMPDWARNYLALTGACLCVCAKTFDKVGGFDEKFIVCGSDVTLGLLIHELGLRNVFWPYARLTHFESQSVGSYDNAPAGDYERSLTFYKKYLDGQDPYFNGNLSLMSEQVELKK